VWLRFCPVKDIMIIISIPTYMGGSVACSQI
jgi:hypothetical protein